MIGIEEIHITKREDGEGWRFVGKGIHNGEPCTVDIPKMQQLNVNLEQYREYVDGYFYDSINNCIFHKEVTFELIAKLKPENDKYYSITIDPVVYAKRRIGELSQEFENVRKEANEKMQELMDEIEKLKKMIQ